MKKRRAESNSIFFRPKRSLSVPAPITPTIQPTSAELTTHPSMTASRENWLFRKPIVPEMTAVSNPKRKPPSVAMKEMTPRYSMLPLLCAFWLMVPSFMVKLIRRDRTPTDTRALVFQSQGFSASTLEVRKREGMVAGLQRDFTDLLNGPVDAIIVHHRVFVNDQPAAVIGPKIKTIDAIPRHSEVAVVDNPEILFHCRDVPQDEAIRGAGRLRRQRPKIRQDLPGSFEVAETCTRRERL